MTCLNLLSSESNHIHSSSDSRIFRYWGSPSSLLVFGVFSSFGGSPRPKKIRSNNPTLRLIFSHIHKIVTTFAQIVRQTFDLSIFPRSRFFEFEHKHIATLWAFSLRAQRHSFSTSTFRVKIRTSSF